MTVFEVVALGRRPYVTWALSKRDIERIRYAMKITNIEHLAHRKIDEVSGGERQRVMIARVLAQEPKVMLLDEPINNLDPKYQIEFMELVKRITKEMKIVTLMSVHDLNLALRYADKVVLMKNGRIYAFGEPEKVLTEENIRNVFDLDVEIVKNPIPYIIVKGVADESRKH